MDIKKRILVDMDGVLSNIYEQFKRYELEDTGTLIERSETLGKTEQEAFVNSLKYVIKKGFWRTIPVMPNAIDTLRILNEKYEVFIISSALEFPNSLEEKYYWMEEHFPFITWKQLVLCGSKVMAKGDIMIDDHFKNLDYFDGRALLFSQPHNFGKENRGHERVEGWVEISKILL
jgi:5'(3')-deoxyribonucleotidase